MGGPYKFAWDCPRLTGYNSMAGHGWPQPRNLTNGVLVRAFEHPTDDFPMKKALRNCSWRPFGLKALLLTSFGQNDPQTVPRDVDFLVTVFW